MSSSTELLFAPWSLADLAEPEGPQAHEDAIDDEELARQLAEAEAREAAAREAAEMEMRLAEAYDRGLEDGRREGEIGESARLRSAVQATQAALDELRDGEQKWSGTIEENVCALAVTIARQVIGRELANDTGPVLNLVQTALGEFPIDQPLRIRVNPSDLASITATESTGEKGLAALTPDREARWLPDTSIAPGGCLIEGRDRIIDGRVDTALERIYRRLTYTHA